MSRRTVIKEPWASVVPWAVLVLGLGTSVAFHLSVSNVIATQRRDELASDVRRINLRVDAEFQRSTAFLHAASGLYLASSELDANEFERFYEAVRLDPAIGTPAMALLTLDRRQETSNARLVAPRNRNTASLRSLDLNRNFALRTTLEAARDSGHPALSELTQQTLPNGQRARCYAICLPIYQGDSLDTTYAQRRADYLGSIVSFIPVDRILNLIAHEAKIRKIGVEVRAGKEVILSAQTLKKSPDLEGLYELDSVRKSIPMRFWALEDYGRKAVILPFILPVGSAVSILFFVLAWVMRNGQRTAEIRERNQWLQVEVGHLTAAGDDDDSILEQIAQAISRTLEVHCRLEVLESDQTLRSVGAADRVGDVTESPEYESARIRALDSGQTQTLNRVSKIATEPSEIQSIVIIPLMARDRAVGVISIGRQAGKTEFDQETINVVEAIAGRTALAIDSARLYRSAQDEIRERRVAEAEVRRLNDDLERRVEERTRDLEASNHELESFCYSVSHDLRTPLRSLDGFSRALLEDFGENLPDEGKAYLDRIRAATKRMDELITALLTLSRLTRREIILSKIDLSELVNEMLSDLDEHQRIEKIVPPGITVRGDVRMMSVLIDNLLANAVKFTGKIEHPRIELGVNEIGEFFIRDNGAGFDPQYASKLFQPFERLHSTREFPGHGIGLATVERIVRRHGGQVRAEGAPGQGATFFVRLPS